MIKDKVLKELGFELEPIDPFTGKLSYVKDNFSYFPSENTICFFGSEFETVKRTVKNERFFRIFIEVLSK